MTDDKMYKLLNKFANDHSIAKGGNIKVSVTTGHIGMKPIDTLDSSFKIEDSNLLLSIINGAESFIFWCRRNNIEIKKCKKTKKQK